MFYHFEFTRGAACLLSTPAPACTTASHANKPAPACMASHERCGAVTREYSPTTIAEKMCGAANRNPSRWAQRCVQTLTSNAKKAYH